MTHLNQKFSSFHLCDEGIELVVSNYGARILSLSVPNGQGEWADVVLGFSSAQEWLTQEPYFNATIGRYANRIKNGIFTLDGTTYHLPINDTTNSIHGGIHGLNVKMWEVEQISSHRITFHYFSPDGEESFPANLHIWVTYSISPHTLDISFRAHADRATVVSLTNHAYFNLSGEGEGTIADHRLQIFANEYTPFDATACPTGEIASITGTLLDFRQPTRLGDRMFHPEFAKWRGINENFILSSPDFLKKAAVLSASGRSLTILTTMPGLQLYTGGYIESCVGKSGRRYAPHHAICLEPQYFPDSPNHAHFPSTRITPNRDFNESIRLVFSY